MPRTARTIGVVVAAKVERYEAQGADGPTQFFRPCVTFEFVADGRRHRGTGPVGLGFGYGDARAAERYVAAHPPLTRVWVRYDPQRPEAARVAEGMWRFVPRWEKRFMLLALVAFAAGVAYVVWISVGR
jgi:hypothetical protein